jgi:hypothetical protein
VGFIIAKSTALAEIVVTTVFVPEPVTSPVSVKLESTTAQVLSPLKKLVAPGVPLADSEDVNIGSTAVPETTVLIKVLLPEATDVTVPVNWSFDVIVKTVPTNEAVVVPAPVKVTVLPEATAVVVAPAPIVHVYVPGMVFTSAQVLFLVKYLSPAPAAPSTAERSRTKSTLLVTVDVINVPLPIDVVSNMFNHEVPSWTLVFKKPAAELK